MLSFVALAGAIALLARENCGRKTGVEATVGVHFGDAASDVRSLRADLFQSDGTSAAFFERAFPSGAPKEVEFAVKVSEEGDYRAELLIDRIGQTVRFTRALRIEDGATIRMDLSR
jgi:hypothetical protein